MNAMSFFFSLAYLVYVVVGDVATRDRRDLGMLRMGLQTRSMAIPPLVRPMYDDMEAEDVDEIDERQTYAIPRMGKDVTEALRYERAPPLPRLGTSRFQQLLDNIQRRDANDQQIRQIFATIPRVGRRNKRSVDGAARIKRAMPLPRLGYRQVAPDDVKETDKRVAPLPRLGMRSDDELDDELIYWPGVLTYSIDDGMDESDNDIDDGKRAAPLPRLGLVAKKTVGMLRMGKRGMGMLRMGKRGMGMLRMGKRGMGMLRMGKRGMGMLRMGRDSAAVAKRAVNMLRMGKRPVGMLRMGKRSITTDSDANSVTI